MPTAQELQLAFDLTIGAIFSLAAGLLLAGRPSGPAPRLLAMFFSVLAVQQWLGVAELAVPAPGVRALDRAWEDLRYVRTLLLLGFLWFYPSRVRLRSPMGLLLVAAAGVTVVVGSLWFLARDLMLGGLGGWVRGTSGGLGLLSTAAVGAALLRASALGPAEQRATYVVLPAVTFSFPFVGFAFAQATLALGGVEGFALLAPLQGAVRGDCCGFSAALLLGNLAVAATLVAWLAWRRRSLVAPALVAWGGVVGVLEGFARGVNVVQMQNIFTPALIAFAVLRHGAFGLSAPRNAAIGALAAGTFGALFVTMNVLTLAISSDPFVASLGTLFGMLTGALGAAVVLLPLARAWLAADRGPPPLPGGFAPPLARGAVALGKYRIEGVLKDAGDRATLLATDPALDRRVVLKTIRPHGPARDALLKEAHAAARVRHPNIVTVYGVDEAGDQAFLVLEHVEGGSLAEHLARGPLEPAGFRTVALGLLDGLAAVHAAGFVHRDVKPSNILLTGTGQPKLADFGIARVEGYETTADGAHASTAIGTARYMSPEQAKGMKATPRSDLYSAAVTLYEAWTGQPFVEPRPSESLVELQLRVAHSRGLDRPLEGPAKLRRWFRKALQPDPQDRFGDAAEMRAQLDATLAAARGRALGEGAKP